MSSIYNIYCDESNHLENSPVKTMALGGIYCPYEKVPGVLQRIKELKIRNGLPASLEIKWTKVSPAKVNFYQDLIDYFFDDDDLHFRAVVIDKNILDHKKFNHSHNDWYYKMYFTLLSVILNPENEYNVYIDIKDTRGQAKISELHEVLSNSLYDFKQSIVKNIQQVRSDEVGILQLVDLLIGAVQFSHRDDIQSQAKQQLVDRIKSKSGYNLQRSTLPTEAKFNIFHWRGSESV